ncbi:MAG: hypothetical protein ACXWQZ_18620, partial [Ktedonobacterales bacterium]
MSDEMQWRELADDEVRRLGIFRPPETDYRFYLFEHESVIHAQAMNVVGVWEEQHDPLLLHARLIHIDGERKFFPEAEPWAYPNLERSPDPHWPSIPASQLQCDV